MTRIRAQNDISCLLKTTIELRRGKTSIDCRLRIAGPGEALGVLPTMTSNQLVPGGTFCERVPHGVSCLQDDLIYQIFLMLPVKTLLRCRCLSKQWNRVISSHRFARDHMLEVQSRCNPNNNIMLLADPLSGTCHSHPQAMLLPVDGHYLPLHNKHRLPFQSDNAGDGQPQEWCCLYSSPCHGMLCAAYYHPSQSAPVIFVWNPLTEQSRQLLWPVGHTEKDFANSTFLGFGYDQVTDDYKIAVHIYDSKTTSATRTYVMALKTANEWRIIDRCPPSLKDCLPVSIKGDLYWITRSMVNQSAISENKYWFSQWMRNKWWRYSIVKFKLSDESWELVDCPPEGCLSMGCKWRICLGQCKEVLCLYNYTSYHRWSRDIPHQMHIWTMHGSTWNRAMSVPETVLQRSAGPLGFTGTGELAMQLIPDHGIIFYDPKTENFEARVFYHSIVDEKGREHLGRTVTYLLLDLDTLISPNY